MPSSPEAPPQSPPQSPSSPPPSLGQPGAGKTVDSKGVRRSKAMRQVARQARPLTEEQRSARLANLQKAREARKSKPTGAQAPGGGAAPGGQAAAPQAYGPEDVRRVRTYLETANPPLLQAEKTLAPLGVEPGELVFSNAELDFGSEAVTGTCAMLSPDFLRYLPVIALGAWSLSILVSRGLVLWRVKQVADSLARQAQADEAELEAAKRSRGGVAFVQAPAASGG